MAAYSLIWEYRIRSESRGAFLEHYGPGGVWVQLFARAAGYLDTSFGADLADALRFVTIDRWRREADWQAFLKTYAAEYAALDARCAAWTTSETRLFAGPTADAALYERRRGPHVVSTDLARLDLGAVHSVLAQSYWSPGIPFATLQRGIAHSLAFGLFEGERTIGFARAVTDRASYAYLADVYVEPACRGQGLGTWLVECVLAHPDLQGLRRFALVTRDAHGLYAKFGFTPLAAPDRHLEIVRPAAELYGG